MKDTRELIDELSRELEPVSSPPSLWRLWGLWLLVSAAWVVLVTHWLGPIRPTALAELQTVPRFTLEMLAGLVGAVGLAVASFHVAVPGGLSRRGMLVALGLAALWGCLLLLALVSPALEPSMLGKRNHCYLEAILSALPPLLALLYWQRRLYTLAPWRAAALAGLAAGLLPALYMQVACMYLPAHILLFHLGPALLTAAMAPLLLQAWNRLAPSGG